MPLREASSSLSIDLDLDHELMELLSPEHSHGTSLSSLTASPVTNCRSSRPNYTGTFQCHSTSERANFRDRSSDGSGRGSRSSGCLAVVGVSLFALLVLCGAKKHRTAALFRVLRSRVTSPRASRPPARLVRWGPSCCRPQIAAVPLRSFAPRARRLSCGAQEKKVGFLDLTTAGLLRFSFCLLFLSFHSSPDPLGFLRGRSADSDFSLNLLYLWLVAALCVGQNASHNTQHATPGLLS